jgi:heme-degrading monooxygenase HmoA
MTTVAVRHHVANYDTWKLGYDGHAVVRKELGCTGDMLLRDASDPNEVLVLTFWPTAADAEAFATDPRLPEVMQKAGVVSEPRIEIYEDADS